MLTIGSTRATARRLRERAEALLEGPFEELWIGSWDTLGERLLREHAEAAGLDPFFDVLGPAERLAMLLDRLDELPLRRHEIRGNPAGLLARLLARIDELKADRVGPTSLEERARERGGGGRDEADREAAQRELEFAELYTAHDRILAEAGSLDRGDVFLALDCLLPSAPTSAARSPSRFEYLMVDELEETTRAQRAILEALAEDNPNQSIALEDEGRTDALPPQDPRPSRAWFRELHPDGDVVVLEHRFREPALRFWAAPTSGRRRRRWRARSSTCSPAGAAPEEICVLLADPARAGRRRSRRRWRSAGSPSTSPGRRRSSSGPRCATRSPGCGCSPTPTTRRRRRER